MKELYEYTIDELLAEVRRRSTDTSNDPPWDGLYTCSTCGGRFNTSHICLGTPSTAGS